MDFKDLLKLAKDNQSYLQKKHEREKQAKVKSSNQQNGELTQQQKENLLRKQKELQLRREARRLQIQQSLIAKKRAQLDQEAAENQKKLSRIQGPASPAHVVKKQKLSTASGHQRESEKKCQKTPKSSTDHRVGPVEKGKNRPITTKADGVETNRKAANGVKNVVSKDVKKPQQKKGGNLSFQELMKLAKEQQNKPATSSVVSEDKSLPGRSNVTSKSDLKSERKESFALDKRKDKGEGSSSRSLSKQAVHKRQGDYADAAKRKQLNSKEHQIKGRERTFNIPAPSDPKRKPPSRNEDVSRKRKLKELDEELERKRRDIERQKRALESKYRNSYQEEEEDWLDDYDEEDLDADLDDFIDDSDSNVNVSSYIQQIFGYNRSRYADDDDDDLKDMESNFGQIQKEEARSARIGKMEDEIERIKEQKLLAKEKRLEKTK